MVYQTESYDYWRRFLGRDDLEHGAFGENFTITVLSDDEVCIGDRYAIGEAEIEVTQPRVTCFRVGLRLDEPDMPNSLSHIIGPVSICASSPKAGCRRATSSSEPDAGGTN